MFCAVALLATATLSEAQMVVGPWTPIFKGIDHAAGTNYPDATIPRLQAVHCLRVDLTDPDVQLFTTPPIMNPVPESQETLSLSISNFIRTYGVQVASDANWGDTPGSEGLPVDVDGFLVSTGRVVSSDMNRFASLLFTANKVPTFHLDNTPPNPNGVYTAVTGFYPLLTNGVNMWNLYYSDLYSAYYDTTIHGPQPRTAFGISQNKRYLFMMTIDGRQSFSEGAIDAETALWLLQFGAWDAINMDGGGSTAMYTTDCSGSPAPLNHSSNVAALNRERILASHFGVYAKLLPSFINNVAGVGGDTNAIITWTTLAPATSQVEYGTNLSYGTFSANDPTPVTNHSVTLTGLVPAKQYYFRVFSSVGSTPYTWDCGGRFRTTNDLINGIIFDVTNNWRYSTANLDAVPSWRTTTYNDSAWSQGQGVFWVETSPNWFPNPNPEIQVLPLNTNQMPVDPSTSYPFTTYYFRTHFTYTGVVAGATLTLSNYVDDGATFYLNGVEINRLFLPTNALNSTPATGSYCPPDNNATCPYPFSVASNLVSSLLKVGDNVLAVEVHNRVSSVPSSDVTFGSALFFTSLVPPPPFLTNVTATPGETSAVITWTTISNSSSLVRYGLTTGLTLHTTNDPTLVTNHSMTLTGLLPLTNYYFRVYSVFSNVFFQGDGTFTTVPFYDGQVSLSNVWVYNTNNLDGVTWQGRNVDESTWLGAGPALFYIETNALVSPRNTPLPATAAGLPAPTYYFRTHFSMTTNVLFVFNTNLAGFSLLFTNYIDDGAVFYLNGTEVQRVRMAPAPAPIRYTNLATACAPVNCAAVASAPDLFRITGSLLTNLVVGGDNVLAAEVHQYSNTSRNVVFGSALGLVRALASETKLHCVRSGNVVSNYWDGLGFTLQQAQTLGGTNAWSDVPGPVTSSPYMVTNPPASTFYRLRN